jgi:pimeloyl-ACP methyl ester carboxylesterase
VRKIGLSRFTFYLHDFGSPIGARLAIRTPECVVALVIQNGDIPYEDALGPKYSEIEKTWTLPTAEMHSKLAESIREETNRFANPFSPAPGRRPDRAVAAFERNAQDRQILGGQAGVDPGPECTARGTRQVGSALVFVMCPSCTRGDRHCGQACRPRRPDARDPLGRA